MASKNGQSRHKNGRFAPGGGGGPGRPRKVRHDAASAPVQRRDGFLNAVTGVGVLGRDNRMASAHSTSVGLDDETAADLWETNPLAARIVETVPNEMFRAGWDLVSGDEREKGSEVESSREIAEQVEARIEELDVEPELWLASCYERAYGGDSVVMLGVNDHRKLEQPLNEETVSSFDWITSFEPKEVAPLTYYADPRAPKFGKPEIYQISAVSPGPGRGGSFSGRVFYVHESRLIIFPGIRVSRQRSRSIRSYGGGSVLTRVWNVLRDHNMGYDAAAILMSDFAQAVYHMTGLAEASAQDLDDEVKTRLQAINYARSVLGAVVVDGEDKFGREQTPVTGLPELLDRFNALLAAAADMPLTLLMGQSPGGMNATGESDIRFFYDRVAAMRQRKLRAAYEKIVRLVFRDLGIAEPAKWKVVFRPLWQESSKEIAEARFLQAQTDEKYLVNMVVSPEDVRRSRFAGDGYSFETSVNFEETAQLEDDQREMDRMAQEQSIRSAQAAAGKSE